MVSAEFVPPVLTRLASLRMKPRLLVVTRPSLTSGALKLGPVSPVMPRPPISVWPGAWVTVPDPWMLASLKRQAEGSWKDV